MTQEDKALLIKDLCARLPYGVKCQIYDENYVLSGITSKLCNELYFEELNFKECDGYVSIECCKPYLFPLSSMTEAQKREYNSLRDFVPTYHYEFGDIIEDTELYDNFESIDYLIANHFDYRNLIPKGLAIDCTGLNIYV